MNSDFYERLDARVRDLENSVRGLRAELDAARAIGDVPAPPAAPPVPEAFAPWPDPARPTYVQMFGRPMPGRAMPVAGLLLVLLAVAFFLDQAFRNGWIGPLERIVLGLVAGSALMPIAARRIGAEYTFLAEGLIGERAVVVPVRRSAHVRRAGVLVAVSLWYQRVMVRQKAAAQD